MPLRSGWNSTLSGGSKPRLRMSKATRRHGRKEHHKGESSRPCWQGLETPSAERQNPYGLGADVQSHHSRVGAILRALLLFRTSPGAPALGPKSGSMGLPEIQETPRTSTPCQALAAAHLRTPGQVMGALGNRSQTEGSMKGAV
jgi:hypothetical protein